MGKLIMKIIRYFSRYRIKITAAVIFSALLFLILAKSGVFSSKKQSFENKDFPKNLIVKEGKNESHRQIKSEVCISPELEIWGKEVSKFYKKIKPLDCGLKIKDWIEFDEIKQSLDIAEFLRSQASDISCSILFITRIDEFKIKRTSFKIDSFPFSNLKSDYFHLFCNNIQTDKKWDKFMMRIVIDDKNNEELSKRHKQNNGIKLNVHIISFDSLSQMSYRRNLPKTVKYFEDTMKGVVLNGYNIVGDGTPQAFLPFLCGKTELEMPDTRKANSNNHYVDEVYPFIWNNYSEKGYVTMYAEDCFDVGTFSYRLNGFKNMPTNHYPRTAYGYVESKFGMAKCIGNEAAHNTWLNYISSYIKAYDKTTPRFALFHHAILSHDDMNLVQVADDDLMNHFKKHFENGDFDNDLVILMADHGNRFAEIRNTHQGQLEERLPFMGIFLPKNFQNTAIGKLYHDNLLKNKDKLSSPFDMHQTLLDILNVPTNKELTTPQLTSKRSLSLFREIPSSRTCFDAGIEKHWCSCMKWENVPNKPFYVQGVKAMANAFINKVNSLTSQERKLCSELKLKKIISSTWLIPKSEMLSYRGAADNDGFVPDLTGEVAIEFADFKIQLQTTPGDAIYDVTINYNFHTNAIVLNMHEVSHINKYGDTPHCIIDKNYFLATYCVCYDTIVNTGN